MRLRIRRGFTIFLVLLSVLAIQVLGFGATVSAITNGQPDGDGHPYVCMVVFDIDGYPVWRTTGILLSPTVVLTAGHGTDGATGARIYTDTNIATNLDYPYPGPTAIEAASIHTNPDYRSIPEPGLPGFDYHDVGIVVLSEPAVVSRYAQLPTVDLVDGLSRRAKVDLVGYGVQWQEKGHGVSPYDSWTWDGTRQVAEAFLIPSKGVITSEFVTVSASPGQDRGGTAFGDSGGPILLAGTDTVLANNSFVTNANCTGVTYANRVDIEDIFNWINSFLD